MARGFEPSPARPWLVADIGGTNARIALVQSGSGEVSAVRSFACADFASPEAAALAYLQQVAGSGNAARPARVALALASAIEGDSVQMTNSAWHVSRAAMALALGADEVVLINDFEALALALPRLAAGGAAAANAAHGAQVGSADGAQAAGEVETGTPPGCDAMRWLGAARPDARLVMAVLGPGTGLGVAACVPAAVGGGRDIALPGEGGHATLAPADEHESELLRLLRKEWGHVSAEHVLSGIGLPSLHRAVCTLRGLAAVTLTAEEISRRARDEHDGACQATLETFCAMLGGFAGNAALTFGARGGVFIAGGIAQKLGDTLAASRFRERFEAKGRFQGYLSRIATGVIMAPHVALEGAARSLLRA